MIPITSVTTLSIEKTATLMQKLFDLRDEQNIELPNWMSSKLDDIIEEQEVFIEDIDDYLHNTSHFEDESRIETITTIVETCPEFLATHDEHGWLPCYYAAEASSLTNTKYLISFVEIGLKHDIGGKGGRGGLLVKNDGGKKRALQRGVKDPDVIDALQKHNPPLFYKKDVKKCKLIHYAATYCSLDLVKYFHNLDPPCLLSARNKYNKFPIHRTIVY